MQSEGETTPTYKPLIQFRPGAELNALSGRHGPLTGLSAKRDLRRYYELRTVLDGEDIDALPPRARALISAWDVLDELALFPLHAEDE